MAGLIWESGAGVDMFLFFFGEEVLLEGLGGGILFGWEVWRRLLLVLYAFFLCFLPLVLFWCLLYFGGRVV